MSMSDNIADMLTRIRNAQSSRLLRISMPNSKAKCAILKVLKEEGYIFNYTVAQDDLTVELKYLEDGSAVISEIHRVSKPGKRIYSAIKDLKGYYNNMGVYVLSTSKGILSDRDARKLNVGGEVICKVF